ncbi:MAG: autotransporter domain-containing protein [Pontiellaceae bacterium]|nr:autotransporter domain-containing protein [Pontiellaceae bacterium]MBN2783662.1 autotransporter domain-containing protein [Pontiellaceae bacterium]
MTAVHPRPHSTATGKKKVDRILVIAFFLLMACSGILQAQTNWVDGDAYGTNDLSTAAWISSMTDGDGDLIIGSSNTTDLLISNNVQGYIIISNRVNGFTLNASSGTVTGSHFAVLSAFNATNLTVNGGSFAGITSTQTSGSPLDLPFSTGTTEAVGGIIFNASNVTLSGSTFSGSEGNDALQVYGSDGITITNGTYAGGEADSETGGQALFVNFSTVTISGTPTFTGGTGAAAILVRNGSLQVDGGTFTGGNDGTTNYYSLVSIASAGATNALTLNEGTFNSIALTGDGIQQMIAGTNLQVDGLIVLDGNTLNVLADDSLSAFQNTLLRSGQINFSDNFNLTAGGYIGYIVTTNSSPLLSADTAVLETNSTIFVDTTLSGFTAGTNTVRLISTTSGIFIIDAAGNTNQANSANIQTNITFATDTGDRTSLTGMIVNNDLTLLFSTLRLSDYLGATGEFSSFLDELEPLLSSEMLTAIDRNYESAATASQIQQTYFTSFNHYQTALQGMRAAVGQSISRGSEFRDQMRLTPPGPRGPEQNNRMRGWTKYYGQYLSHDEEGMNPGYDTILHGGVVGIDTSFGNLLIGFSGGSSHSRITQDTDAQSDTDAYHGNLYSTYGFERGFIDAGVAYGTGSTDTRTTTPFRLDGNFDSEMTSTYLGAGYDLTDRRGTTIFTPEASVQYATYNQEAYTEQSSSAVPRHIKEFDADSLLTTIGLNISMLNQEAMETFAYKLDLRLHWMHEFNADPSALNFTLQNGGTVYPISGTGLDEDYYRIGIGSAFFNTQYFKQKNVMLRIDFDELFGDGFNSHNLSAKVIYAF